MSLFQMTEENHVSLLNSWLCVHSRHRRRFCLNLALYSTAKLNSYQLLGVNKKSKPPQNHCMPLVMRSSISSLFKCNIFNLNLSNEYLYISLSFVGAIQAESIHHVLIHRSDFSLSDAIKQMR